MTTRAEYRTRTLELLEIARRTGATAAELAKMEGISKQAMEQRFSRAGNCYSKLIEERRAARKNAHIKKLADANKARRESWADQCQRTYLCSLADFKRVAGDDYCGVDHSTRTYPACAAYHQQRRNAALRGIAFALSLPDWWAVWQASGKWEKRGKGRTQYGLSRISRDLPFQVGNVTVRANGESSGEHLRQTLEKIRRSTPDARSIRHAGAAA